MASAKCAVCIHAAAFSKSWCHAVCCPAPVAVAAAGTCCAACDACAVATGQGVTKTKRAVTEKRAIDSMPLVFTEGPALPAAALAEHFDHARQPLAAVLPVHAQAPLHTVSIAGKHGADNLGMLFDREVQVVDNGAGI
jgi:hypothetical protein